MSPPTRAPLAGSSPVSRSAAALFSAPPSESAGVRRPESGGVRGGPPGPGFAGVRRSPPRGAGGPPGSAGG
eukprot:1920732-Prymnesium_polylepis.1